MIVLGAGLMRSQQIAVVEMEGAIGQRIKAAEYGRLFRSLGENHRVRAVVLDIDSPGGSATASDYLYLSIAALARSKPVVAFIRGVGASGAYLLSCPASRIVAIPSALIGSIGVISMRPLLHDTLERIGLKVSVTKSDRLKDMGSMFREATPEEEEKEQALVDDLYDQFLDAVAAGRHLDKARVKELATGEIYTARKAQGLGLVDELGDLERALDVAAELASVTKRPVWVRPRRSLREAAGSLFVGAFVDAVASRIEERLAPGVYYQHRP